MLQGCLELNSFVAIRAVCNFEAYYKNQPWKTKLSLYKPLSYFKIIVYMKVSRKMEALVVEVGVACVCIIHVSRLLKEELTWATNKQLWIISNITQLYH